jgi:hypothetical protein
MPRALRCVRCTVRVWPSYTKPNNSLDCAQRASPDSSFFKDMGSLPSTWPERSGGGNKPWMANAAFPPLPSPRPEDALDAILAYRHPPTQSSEFRFEWSADAAAHNWDLLRRYDCDLGSALLAQFFHPDVWVRVPARTPLITPLVLAPTVGGSRSASPMGRRSRCSIFRTRTDSHPCGPTSLVGTINRRVTTSIH